jgi:folate-dependent phosphoribosylglycinamide formyltransferase PurN/rhamnogalacturonyl hydrolase YesR
MSTVPSRNYRWLYRQAIDAAVWRPSHAKLLIDQVVDRLHNERAGYSDDDHLSAAVGWLERAQDATDDGGVAGRYRLGSGWTTSYPETTGYIVPTLLDLANAPGGDRFRDRARRCIDFLLPLQRTDGGFPGGEVQKGTSEPSFFNTGQIIAGLLAWHRATKDERSLEAARRAADWLVGLQESDGSFRHHLYYNLVTTYSAHCSCWVAELGHYLREPRYLNMARRHVDWVLTHRDTATGWIDLAGFSEQHHRARQAVTHTIAYTLWGVLRTAQLVGHGDAFAAVEQASLGIARRLELSSRLPGVLDHQWRPAATYACLTGNCQMALVWMSLYDRTRDSRFLNAALKAIDLVKRAQPMRTGNGNIRGGVPGSDPVWGDYIRMALPNWAAKFFIDALLKKRAVLADLPARPRELAVIPSDVAQEVPSSRPLGDVRPLRVVLLTSSSSNKVARMLRTWQSFRPAAVVILQRQSRSVRERLVERIQAHGLAPLGREAPPQAPAAVDPARRYHDGKVTDLCREARIRTIEVDSFHSESGLRAITALEPDLFVFAGGAILRAPLLAIPRLGTLNAHMGILPFYRGMNVAEWAFFHGDVVGCSVHLIDAGIDTGDIVCVRPVSIDGVRSVAELRDRVDDAQMSLLGEVVRYVTSVGQLPPLRRQSAAEGRQYFRMHHALRSLLERELASWPGDRASQAESALSV